MMNDIQRGLGCTLDLDILGIRFFDGKFGKHLIIKDASVVGQAGREEKLVCRKLGDAVMREAGGGVGKIWNGGHFESGFINFKV